MKILFIAIAAGLAVAAILYVFNNHFGDGAASRTEDGTAEDVTEDSPKVGGTRAGANPQIGRPRPGANNGFYTETGSYVTPNSLNSVQGRKVVLKALLSKPAIVAQGIQSRR